MTKAIIFDFDGVIADTFDISLEIAKQINPSLTREIYLDMFMGNVYHKATSLFSEQDIVNFFDQQKKAFSTDNFFDVRPQIEELSKRYKLYIVSGTVDDSIKHFLKLGEFDGFFDKILGATTHRSKIARFNMILDEYHYSPDECIFVTDTVGDIVEATEVGIKTIAVSWGYHDEQLLLGAKPTAIAHTPDELSDIIATQSK
jgi:phosphoglycolate phosphatase